MTEVTQGGILTGNEIRRQVESKGIYISPWTPGNVRDEEVVGSQINPASYDLTLGNKVSVYKTVTMFSNLSTKKGPHGILGKAEGLNPRPPKDIGMGEFIERDPAGVLNVKTVNQTWDFEIDPGKGWLLKPGIGYLMHTHEIVLTKRYVPVLDGKSSMGRLFVTAHVTAGYGDPGFNGQYTLECVALYPTVVFPGMRFCQIRFHTMVGEPIDYEETGTYKGGLARGPIASQSWKQFTRV